MPSIWNFDCRPRLLWMGILAVLGLLIVWCPALPLGVPQEWQWSRHSVPADVWEWLDRLLPACLTGVVFLLFARWGDESLARFQRLSGNRQQLSSNGLKRYDNGQLGRSVPELPGGSGLPDDSQHTGHAAAPDRKDVADENGSTDPRIGRRGIGRRVLLLTWLVMLTLGWQWAVQRSAPEPYRDLKPLWIVYDKYASGYFYEAAFRIDSASALLSGYEARMREGDVLHVGTHPPGLFLLSLAALDLTARSPGLVTVLESVRSSDGERAFRELEAEAHLSPPLTRSQVAALQLVSMFTLLLAGLAVVPVFLLTQVVAGPVSGWRAACLYASVPAIAVFFPKSDVLYPFTMMLFLWLGCASLWARRTWTGWLAAILAGCALFAGMLLSLAHLPAVVVLTLVAGQRLWRASRHERRQLAGRIVAMGLAWGMCTAVFSLITECPLPIVWQLNLMNHAGFYETSVRTWWKWTLVNPLELALSAGLPLSWLACETVWRAGARWGRREPAQAPIPPALALVTAMTITAVVLWLSGKNMGEAARLWCFLTPWLALIAGLALPHRDAGTAHALMQPEELKAGRASLFSWILVLQLLTATGTVARVNGFSI